MRKVQSDPKNYDPKGAGDLYKWFFVHHHFKEKNMWFHYIGHNFYLPIKTVLCQRSFQLTSIGTSGAPWDDGFCLRPAERPELSELFLADFFMILARVLED